MLTFLLFQTTTCTYCSKGYLPNYKYKRTETMFLFGLSGVNVVDLLIRWQFWK